MEHNAPPQGQLAQRTRLAKRRATGRAIGRAAFVAAAERAGLRADAIQVFHGERYVVLECDSLNQAFVFFSTIGDPALALAAEVEELSGSLFVGFPGYRLTG